MKMELFLFLLSPIDLPTYMLQTVCKFGQYIQLQCTKLSVVRHLRRLLASVL
jgi:hypothetical protein